MDCDNSATPLFTPTFDLPPYNCIQPPPIKHTLPVYIYVWEDCIAYSNTPPGKSDKTLIDTGCLNVLEVIDGVVYDHSYDGNKYSIDEAIDYGDYHSVERPF
jgi:hypothetical protein